MNDLHSLALSVQLQTTPVGWDKAISVDMVYFILIGLRILTVEGKSKRTKEFDTTLGLSDGPAKGKCEAEASEREFEEKKEGC